jgi:myo-inositol 2-dehydrogenase/D-chiro-inositol 1-dehydrogenase
MHFALFGAGRVGWVHAQNIANHPDATLSHVYDVDSSASERVVEALGGKVAEAPGEIWDADGIDAVLIASSTNTHVDLLRGAIRSGKAVYCEKPIDLDLAKVRAFTEEVRGTDVPVLIGFRRRFLSELQAIHERIRGGDIGRVEIVHIIARDLQPPSIEYIKVSGGLLSDMTVHSLDLLCWLTDEAPIEVHATGACLTDPKIGQAGDIDTVMVTLRMPSGALCQITNGRRSAFGDHERVEVYGALGLLQWDPSYERQVITHATHSGVTLSRAEPDPTYIRQETFAAALDAFIRSVKAGETVTPSLADGLRAQIIADAATESLASNRPVAIVY